MSRDMSLHTQNAISQTSVFIIDIVIYILKQHAALIQRIFYFNAML
jgi:hypothetical protein